MNTKLLNLKYNIKESYYFTDALGDRSLVVRFLDGSQKIIRPKNK